LSEAAEGGRVEKPQGRSGGAAFATTRFLDSFSLDRNDSILLMR
jgi:hypothetical protein